MKISVVGLGKLGSPLVASIASKGFEVVGVDINEELVNQLSKGISKLNEPGLSELLKASKAKISATTSISDAVLSTEITFVIVPTPSQSNGEFALDYVIPAMEKIGEAIKNKKKFHLVLLTSTVMPGSTQKIQQILEKKSGKICGRDFGLCYNPEFIALGNVIKGLLNPDFILIGESDIKSGDMLVKFYKKYCDNKPRFARMNYVNAELAKISFNTYVTTKISYANMLAEICENLPGGNVDLVTGAIGLHSIIGSKYIKGGVGYGGPCFPRDNIAFIKLAKKIKADASIAATTHKTNLRQLKRLIDSVLKHTQSKEKVGILGLSYKPDTDVVEQSHSFLLTEHLMKKGVNLNLYDPIALVKAKSLLGDKPSYEKSAKSCIDKSDVIVLGTNWPEFFKLNPKWFINTKVVIDPWRMLFSVKLPDNVLYIPFGVNR